MGEASSREGNRRRGLGQINQTSENPTKTIHGAGRYGRLFSCAFSENSVVHQKNMSFIQKLLFFLLALSIMNL